MSRRPPRRKLRGPVADSVILSSRRRCCFCFGHDADFTVKHGQIAHIDGDRTNDCPSNLAYVCLVHHNAYDSGSSQAKGLTPRELRACKAALEAEVRRRLPDIAMPDVAARRRLRSQPTPCEEEDDRRRDLLACGAGFLLPTNASSLLTHLRATGSPEVQRMLDLGQFVDDFGRELLILPPMPKYLEFVEGALEDAGDTDGSVGPSARSLLEEIRTYRIALEVEGEFDPDQSVGS
ncbi:MAG: hypothetical protein KF878_17415 [Planctomycetes bacterium]|nr:hypothetical protein [Planctomycetota bacterium]